jgi:aldehyde dehydrogenase (NAD+)
VAHALMSIIHEAGAPAGIANLVLGRGIIGDALSKHPDVNGVSFTGSQTVGAKVAQAALSHFARVQMEMGGKNPLVVLDDAELDRAIQIAVDGGYFATGQRCTASSRVFVQAGIYDKFVEGVAARAKALKVGNALDATTQMGPAVTDTQLAGNLKYVDIALKEGGRLLAGGAEPLKLATPGHYMSPTLIVDTKIGDTINQEEVFGPVVSVVKIKDYEEGLAHSNSGNFGLSAGIVTTSLKHARHYQRNVKAGMVMINLPTAGVDYHVPFGGSRGSSYGAREQGFAAVDFFTQIKTAYSFS